MFFTFFFAIIAKTRMGYGRGEALFFLILPLDLGAYDLSPEKLNWRKTKLLPDRTVPLPSVYDENHAK